MARGMDRQSRRLIHKHGDRRLNPLCEETFVCTFFLDGCTNLRRKGWAGDGSETGDDDDGWTTVTN